MSELNIDKLDHRRVHYMPMASQRKTEILATFFYLGRAPILPGTFGTLGAIPLVYMFSWSGQYGYMLLSFLFILFSIWVADQYESLVQDHDRKELVIDEVAGFIIAMFWMPHSWQAFVYAFLIFRILDIFKPFPINLIDRRAQGGFGVVMDDIVAGVITNVVMQMIYTQTDWLGAKYLWPD